MTLAINLVIGLPGCQKSETNSARDSKRSTSSVDGLEPTSEPPQSPKPEGHAIKPTQPKPKRVLTPPQSPLPEGDAMSTENALSIFEYLYMMGDTLDCYFTVERAGSTAHRSPYVALIEPDEEVTSIDDLVEKLNNDVDGLTATRSSRWPKVIHLVDDTLGSVSGYAIEQEVSFEFSGTVDKLVLRLGEEFNGRIGRVKGGGIPQSAWDLLYDDETKATIDVQNEKVRNVLTSAVPLENYNRVLWGATTYTTNGEHRAEVSFGGPPWEEE
jgi:hypothetical protein